MVRYSVFPLLGVLGCCLMGCAGGSETSNAAGSDHRVHGTLTKLDRMALPPEAVITVTLTDVSRMDAPAPVLAETTFTAAGRQVPFTFQLQYDPAVVKPENSYAVRATIRIGDRLTYTTDTVYPVITRESPTRVEVIVKRVPSPPPAAGAAPRPSLDRYRAVEGRTKMGDNTATWTAYFDGDELKHIKESSEAGDHGNVKVEYWFENGRLMSYSSTADQAITDPARQPGKERVALELRFNAAGETLQRSKTVDGKATEASPTEVLGATTRADLLAKEAKRAAAGSTALLGTSWKLVDLHGRGVVENAEATLEFPEEGKVAGKGSCNRYFGSVQVSVRSITFDRMGSTMMACPDAIMKQERAFLQSLEAAERFEIQGAALKIYCRGADKPLRFVRRSQ